MGYKSRGNFRVNFCMKSNECENKDKKCKECLRYNEFKKKVVEKKKEFDF